VQGLASRQAAAGHDVRIITATPGHGQHRSGIDEVQGLPVVRIAARVPFDLPVHPTVRSSVLRVLRQERIDVAHVHTGVASPFAWGGLRACRQANCAAVVTVHSMWDRLSRGGVRVLDRTAWGLSSGVVLTAVGASAAMRVQSALGVPVRVLPNGIDTRAWRVEHLPVTDETNAALRVVGVLRLAPRKRAMALMHVIAQAHEATGGRIDATIIGDGPESGRVERFIDRHDLRAAVTLTGRLSHPRIRAHFARSDAFVQASVRESFGIAALEARAAGLPIIARDQSGTAEFVRDKVEGLLAADDRGLVAALVELQADRQLRREIREHNTAIAPKQDWSNVLVDVEEAYRLSLARRSSRDERALG